MEEADQQAEPTEDQAEQIAEADPNPRLPNQEDDLQEDDQADLQAEPPEDQAEQMEEADPNTRLHSQEDALPEDDPTSTSFSYIHTSIIQSLAILRAVPRCVEFPVNNNIVQPLTSHKLGTFNGGHADQGARADHTEAANKTQADQMKADPAPRLPNQEVEARTAHCQAEQPPAQMPPLSQPEMQAYHQNSPTMPDQAEQPPNDGDAPEIQTNPQTPHFDPPQRPPPTQIQPPSQETVTEPVPHNPKTPQMQKNCTLVTLDTLLQKTPSPSEPLQKTPPRVTQAI